MDTDVRPAQPTEHGLRAGDRVLITGARGLVGSAVSADLAQQGNLDVIGVGSDQVDLTDWSATRDLIEAIAPDVVFHLAARVYGLMGNLENQSRVFTENIRINTNVVEASALAGVRKIVAMGSAAVYSDSVSLPMRECDVWAGPPHESERPYAHAKRAMLAHLETAAKHTGMSYAFCVSTNLYGPDDCFDERWGHVIPSLVSKFRSANTMGTPVVVWGSGTPTRDLLYSLDAARALRLIAQRAVGTINLATGTSHSIREIVEALARVSGYSGEIVWDATKPDGQLLRSYDVTRLERLGFVPEHSLVAGLSATYDWFCRNVATARGRSEGTQGSPRPVEALQSGLVGCVSAVRSATGP
ncbi:MAG: GDP-L-fucose synthase family protein [Microthrixaceae bacterium]